MARKNKGAALVSAAMYGFASGIGRQAARDVYSSVTDSKLQPDYSKAVCTIDSETKKITFDRIKKDMGGKLHYVSIQTLPLVWYDKRWKKFREGALPDGTSKVATEVSYDKEKLDQIASEEGYTIVTISKSVEVDKKYWEDRPNNTGGVDDRILIAIVLILVVSTVFVLMVV